MGTRELAAAGTGCSAVLTLELEPDAAHRLAWVGFWLVDGSATCIGDCRFSSSGNFLIWKASEM
jgi:hypothetical protein